MLTQDPHRDRSNPMEPTAPRAEVLPQSSAPYPEPQETVASGMRLVVTAGARRGSRSSGIGSDAKRCRANRASHRAQDADRWTRALSVAIPVFAYIWRYIFETITNARRARRLFRIRE